MKNDTKKEKKAVNKDADRLSKIRKEFDSCVEFESKNRSDMVDDLRFKNGDQWPEGIRKQREQDPNGPRPVLTINKLPQFINQVKNDQRQNRPAVKVRPVDDKSDPKVAEVLQGIIRHIEDQSNADIAYDIAFESALSCGLGYFRVITDWVDNESFDQEIKIQKISNPFTVYMSPETSEPDGSDCKYAFITEKMKEDEFKTMFPSAYPVDWGVVSTGEDFREWYSENIVRIAEYFYIEEEKKKILLLSNGMVVPEDRIDDFSDQSVTVVKERESTVKKVKWMKLCGNQILEEKEWAGSHIPIIRVIGNEENIEGDVIRYGLIRFAKDPQRMYNFWRTAAAEMIALSPKAPFIGAAGQFANFENKWKTANSTNYAYLEYNPVSISGQVAPAPQRNPYSVDIGVFTTASQITEHDIQTTMGIYNASLGEKSNERTGRAILARQKEGDTATFHYIDNLSRSIRYCGRILVDLIPKIYDTQRILRIIGEDGNVKPVQINPEAQVPFEKVQTVEGVMEVFNPSIGKYDVSVDVGPSYNTKRQESVEAMLQLVQANPGLVQIVGDLMIRNMDWPGADEIANRLQKMLPPKLQEEQSPIPPEIQAQIEQAMNQHMQIIEQLKAENEQLKSKQQEKMAELAIKAKTSEADATLEAEKIQAEYELKQQELEAQINLERQKMVAELELMREKAIAEITMKSEIEMMKIESQACSEMNKENSSAQPEEAKEEKSVVPNIIINMPSGNRTVTMKRTPEGMVGNIEN